VGHHLLYAAGAFAAERATAQLFVAPLDGGFRVPDGVAFQTYRMPAPDLTFGSDDTGRVTWAASALMAVVPCRSMPMRVAPPA
jgi:hypothetical protein